MSENTLRIVVAIVLLLLAVAVLVLTPYDDSGPDPPDKPTL